jgi:LacI family transcriptional regulator
METRDFKISLQEGFEGARAAVRDIVKSGFNPTAIICVNDMIAIGALRELRDHGIDVPGHVSVTGFDNIEFSEFTAPSLTTIKIPRDKVGHRMFEAILAGARNRSNAGEEYMFSPELVVRESTGVARASSDSRRTRSKDLTGVMKP